MNKKQVANILLISLAFFFVGGSIASSKVKTLKKVTAGSISNVYLADNAVTSNKIGNGSVTGEDLADNSVSSGKISDGAVTESDIGDSVITSSKIAADSVDSGKIASGAVTGSELADNAVTSAKISDGTIANADISSAAAIDSNKINYDGKTIDLGFGTIKFSDAVNSDYIQFHYNSSNNHLEVETADAAILDLNVNTMFDGADVYFNPYSRVELSSRTFLYSSSSAPTCNSNYEGVLYYNTSSHHAYVCNGTNWVQLDN